MTPSGVAATDPICQSARSSSATSEYPTGMKKVNSHRIEPREQGSSAGLKPTDCGTWPDRNPHPCTGVVLGVAAVGVVVEILHGHMLVAHFRRLKVAEEGRQVH